MKKIVKRFMLLSLVIIAVVIFNNKFISNKPIFESKMSKVNYVVPNEYGTEVTASVNSVDFGTIARGFSQEEADAVLVGITFTNVGTTNVTLDNTNPSQQGPFGNYAYDNELVLEPGDSINVMVRPADSSAFANTPGTYNGTYVFTATNVENNEDTFVINIPVTITLIEPTIYTVNFETYEGSPIDSQYIIEGTHIGRPDDPVLDGYLFMGWYTDDTFNVEYNFEDGVYNNITLFAKWVESRTVIINANGGNELEHSVLYVPLGTPFYEVAGMMDEPTHSNPMKYLEGVKINSLESEMLTDEQIMELTVEEDLTVYLIWGDIQSVVEEFEVTINPYVAGHTSELVYSQEEDSYVPSEIPGVNWPEDERFGSFNPNYVEGTCYENRCENTFLGTFTAGQTYYMYLTFATTENYYVFSEDILEHVVVHNGYIADVAENNGREIRLVVAFTALNEVEQPPEESTITFVTNGADPIDAITRNYGETITLPTPEKDGYVFGGWEMRDEEDHPVGIMAGGEEWFFEFDETLYAIWYDEDNEIAEIELTLEPPFIGTTVTNEEIEDQEHGGMYFEQTPMPIVQTTENAHYHIARITWVNGLCDEEHDIYLCHQDFEGQIVANTDYYALIEIETDQEYFINEDIGEHILVNGVAPEQINDMFGMNYIVFTAKVRSVKENYEVNFKDGETILNTLNIHYNNFVEVPNPNPEKPANGNISYVFAGWYTDDTFNIPFDFGTPITSDTDIYVKWQEVVNKTVYYYDGETLLGTAYTNDRAMPMNPNPEKNGYTFVGWYADDTLNVEYDFSQNIVGNSVNLYAKFTKNKSNIEFTVTATGTILNMFINGTVVLSENENQEAVINKTVENAGYYDEENSIRIIPQFGEHLLASVTINGTEYTGESLNVTVNNDEWVIVVPGSATYTIVAVADEESAVPRTIIWANTDANENAEEYDEDMVIEHGSAKIIGIYNSSNEQVSGQTDVDNDGMGYVVVNPGDNVLFEFTPEYGYQLTSILVNGMEVSAEAAMNQYSFEMPDANVHFQAVFKRTEDVVASSSEKVTSGTITLGSNLDGGSAKLTISDIELSADKIKDFENYASDYTLKNFLDIDLYNIFYKGKDDANDVWSNKIDELNEYATITIKLADNVDVSNVVLVHNIHDGEQYEIIEIESYDKVNNTITFKTKSFSNYAIATKNTTAADTTTADEANNKTTEKVNTVTNETTSPKTLDNIGVYFMLLLVSGLSLAVAVNKLRKN